MIRNWIAVIFVMGCVFHGHVSGKKDNPDPVNPAPVAPTSQPASEAEGQAVSLLFLRKLFRKYGGDGVMTFEGFEHLMENIGLGNVEIPDHDVHDHQTKTGFREFHEDHDHNKTVKNHPEDLESPAGERQTTKQYPEEEEKEEELAKNMKKKKKKKTTNKKKKKEPKQDNSTVLVTGRGGEAVGTRNKRWSSAYVEQKCATPVEILRTFDIEYSAGIRPEEFVSLCPAIVYQLDQQLCHSRHPACHSSSHNHSHAHCPRRRHHHHHHGHADDAVVTAHGNHSSTAATTSWKTWLYATLAVTAISLVGLGGVAVIPVMDRIFYNQLLQFLIALAVGTLSGDALVHLLPHAMVPHSHSETPHCAGSSEETDSHKDKDSVWIGLIALMGIVFFFLMERILNILSDHKKRRRRVVQRTNEDEGDAIGLKLCEPMTAQTTTTDEIILSLHENTDEDIAVGSSMRSQKIFRGSDEFWFRPTPAHHTSNTDDEVTHSEGQGHGQGHGHSHVVPKSVTSAAWMVIMGDGLHNFTDGLAIGASFANSLAVGLSTTIAVFCHELPHELGDFAVLLKAGMTIRQALVYNIVSSILCFVGMTIGVWVGKMESATAWIFAATAGIFLYIALVDMIPQLSSPSSSSSSSSSSNNRSDGFRTLVLHGFGVACGLGTMLVIALYEDSIQLAVGDT